MVTDVGGVPDGQKGFLVDEIKDDLVWDGSLLCIHSWADKGKEEECEGAQEMVHLGKEGERL